MRVEMISPKAVSMVWRACLQRWCLAGVLACGVAIYIMFGLAGVDARVVGKTANADDHGEDISLFGSYLAARQAGNDRDRRDAAKYLHDALKLDPGNSMLLELAMVYVISSGGFVRGLELAPRVAEVSPNNLGANVLLGLKALKSGNYPASRARFAANDAGPIARFTSGLLEMWVHQAAGNPEAARGNVENLDESSTFGSFRAYHSALLAEMQGRNDDADIAYAAAYESVPRLRVVDAYGRFLERHGAQERAIEIYKSYLEDVPDHPIISANMERVVSGQVTEPLVQNPLDGVAETLYVIGLALSQDGGRSLALIYLNLALYIRPDFDMVHFLIGNIHDKQNRHEEAIEAYSEISLSSPLSREAEIQAVLNLNSLDRVDEAKFRLDALIAQNPSDRLALISCGTIMRAHERFGEALDCYNRAIKLPKEPGRNDWKLYYFRGISYERTGLWDKAEVDFKAALELEPEQPFVLNYLGYSWIDLGVNLDIALDMVKRAVGLRPDDGYIADSLGWAYYRLGNFEEAVEELERAVVLKPDDPVINDHLGNAYWRVGRVIEARFQWNHALTMEPEEVNAKKIELKLVEGLAEVEPKKIVAETAPAVSEVRRAFDQKTVATSVVEKSEAIVEINPKKTDETRTYIVEDGDNLWNISKKFLGDGRRFEMLFEANRDRIGAGFLIHPGEELIIPNAQ